MATTPEGVAAARVGKRMKEVARPFRRRWTLADAWMSAVSAAHGAGKPGQSSQGKFKRDSP